MNNNKHIRRFMRGVQIVLAIIVILLLVNVARGVTLTQDNAIRAIMGEAAGEPYEAKLWIACVIRNNGTLIGVYGGNKSDNWFNSQPAKAQADCLRAWRESKINHVTNCHHFGGVIDDWFFITGNGWKPVKTIGNTRFYL